MMYSMKDSGVEWIGTIPENWSIIPMKSMFSFSKGLPITKADLVEKGIPVISYGQIHSKRNTGIRIEDEFIRYVPIEYRNTNPQSQAIEGDILFADTSEDYDGIGNCIRVDGERELYAGYHTIIARPKESRFSKYWAFLFQTDSWRSQLRLQASGIKVFSITQKMLNGVSVIIPSLKDGTRIADYLDAKCAKIDTLIAKQQEIIEKLKAYKLSVITEAVTKGLNPNVPMKDSGIEWIGVIPEQWRLSHIGNLAEIGAGGTPDRKKPEYWENGTIRWMASGEINYEYVYDTTEKITELGMQNSNAKLLPVNTVMLGLIGQGKTKGMTAILKTECACNQNLAYLIPNPDLLHYGYLFYCFKAMYHYIRGLVGESQAGIYQDFLKKQHIPLPNIEVQAEICDYLDRVAAAIDIYVVRREEQMKKLVDYKKSLIYEVVTGKREV